jgi:hypothetical protein
MLKELLPTRQVEGEPRRRWFRSDRCDLIVWLRDDGAPEGFQLCYDKDYQEHALTWISARGFSHMRVDSGAGIPGYPKGTPILVADGAIDADRILDVFSEESGEVPPELVRLVSEKVAELAA